MYLFPYQSFCFLLLLCTQISWASGWKPLAPGLDLGLFRSDLGGTTGKVEFTLLRIHPDHWNIKVLANSNQDESNPISTHDWAKRYGLVAVINAGMYQKDYRTHAGYMKVDQHLNNRGLNRYQSFAAFGPYDKKKPAFQIYDRDSIHWNLPSLRKNYRFVLQNLRLIKHPALNRWQPQAKRWSEAALGQDRQGRMLFLFCAAPLSMYNFNKALLSLPIDLLAAQHLEGGPKAQMYIAYQDTQIELGGSYESGFPFMETTQTTWPLPNIIGVAPLQTPKGLGRE